MTVSPTEAPAAAVIAHTTDRPVIRVLFDSDVGVVVEAATPDRYLGQFDFILSGESGEHWFASDADLELVAAWTQAGLISKTRAAELVQSFRRKDRAEWLLSHGVERLLGLPYERPISLRASADERRELATELVPHRQSKAEDSQTSVITSENAPRPTALAELTPQQRRTVELHCLYFLRVWDATSWKVYHRYKKHLPGHRRRDVDEFLTALDRGAKPDALVRRMAELLDGTWDSEDWLALISDDALWPSEPEQADWWRNELAQGLQDS